MVHHLSPRDKEENLKNKCNLGEKNNCFDLKSKSWEHSGWHCGFIGTNEKYTFIPTVLIVLDVM